MSPEAKALWRRITGAKPPDYFEPAAQELLAQFCELAITQRLNLAMLRRERGDAQWRRQAARMQPVLNSLAVKLRLTPSAVLSKKDGRLTETGIDTDGDDGTVVRDVLFGGGKPRF